MIRGLYGMVDRSVSPDRDERQLCEALLSADVRVLQLRMKGASEAAVEATLLELLPLCQDAGATLVLNDRVELAARHEGVGVHLGQEDLDPVVARGLLGPSRLIGLSTHDLEQVKRASELPVDYLGFGPIFSAATKHLSPGDDRRPAPAVGVELLATAVAASRLPLVAIGGIDLPRLPGVLASGVAAVALIGAVCAATDVGDAARAVQRCFVARELTP